MVKATGADDKFVDVSGIYVLGSDVEDVNVEDEGELDIVTGIEGVGVAVASGADVGTVVSDVPAAVSQSSEGSCPRNNLHLPYAGAGGKPHLARTSSSSLRHAQINLSRYAQGSASG